MVPVSPTRVPNPNRMRERKYKKKEPICLLPVRSVRGFSWTSDPVEPRNLSVLCGSGRRESMFSFYRYPNGGFRITVTIGGLTVVIDWS